MKKHLLFVAALLCAGAASAQTFTWTCSHDGTTANFSATSSDASNTKTVASNLVINSDCYTTAQDADYKDTTAATVLYSNGGYIKFTPVESETKDFSTNSVKFTIEEKDETKYLSISKVSFGAQRVGTDAVRLNVKYSYEGDGGPGSTAFLIATQDDFTKFCDGEIADTALNGVDLAWRPVRDDLNKSQNQDASGKYIKTDDPFNYFTDVAPVLPANIYKFTVEVYTAGIANNKNFILKDMTIVNGTPSSSKSFSNNLDIISTEYYNIAGARLNAPERGVNIVRNIMSDGSFKTTKLIVR